MTPERVAQLADACTPYTCGSSNDAEVIARAITQAVNEFADEAERKMNEHFDREAKAYAHYTGNWHAASEWYANRLSVITTALDTIRALKLPEE